MAQASISLETQDDLRCMSFAHGEEAEAYLEGARSVARDIERPAGGGTSAQLAQAVAAVAALQAGELLESLDSGTAPAELMFLLAHELAQAWPDAAWQGLLPAVQAGLPARGRLAFPVAGGAGAPRWVCWSPAGDCGTDLTWLLLPEHGCLAGPLSGDELATHFDVAVEAPLMGFAQGRAEWIRRRSHDPMLDRRCADMPPAALQRALNLHRALLAGLLAGVATRMAATAYSYAKTRHAGGKPIIQHQAVALRLADIAMNQQALQLSLCSAVSALRTSDPLPLSLHAGHVGDLAFRVARDAVQVAGAHGYVEGLPLKGLFEQVRTLSMALGATTVLPAQAVMRPAAQRELVCS